MIPDLSCKGTAGMNLEVYEPSSYDLCHHRRDRFAVKLRIVLGKLRNVTQQAAWISAAVGYGNGQAMIPKPLIGPDCNG